MSRSRWQQLACFADTGFFYALVDSGDRWHTEAQQILRQVQQQNRIVVTSTLVVAEAHALMLYRLGTAALQWVSNVGNWVEILPEEPAHHRRAVEILSQYADQQFTYTDAVSFALIEAHGVSVAFSMDKHFIVFQGAFLTLPLAGVQLPVP